MQLSRRDFIKGAGLGAGAGLTVLGLGLHYLVARASSESGKEK